MLELRLTGIHDDGENLVLEAADGSSYLLPIDQNLRQSIAKARRITPVRGGGGTGVFGPRDIQARFRQGATVEEIAAESGWEPERVRRYEWPIVAERANIIQTARQVVISAAPGSQTPAQTLNAHIDAVSERYGFTGLPTDWSTWQQETGQWTLALDLSLPQDVQNELPRGVMFPARWNFNPANQSLYASNEAAYFLMGRERTVDGPLPGVGASTSTAEKTDSAEAPAAAPETAEAEHAEPSLTRVRLPENREQNELLDELTARRGARSFDPASERKLADLLERARRSSRPAGEVHAEPAPAENPEPAQQVEPSPVEDAPLETPVAEQEAAPAEILDVSAPAETTAGEVATQAPEETPAETEATQEVTEAEAEQVAPVEDEAATEPDAVDSADSDGDQETESPRAGARASRGKRTSVPSWDDIIFGNQRR